MSRIGKSMVPERLAVAKGFKGAWRKSGLIIHEHSFFGEG